MKLVIYLETKIFDVTDGELYTPNRIEKAVYASLGRAKPVWRMPRGMFFFAALIAHIIGLVGIKKNTFGLQLYRNLVGARSSSGSDSSGEYEFTPTSILETEIPQIIKFLEME